MTWIVRKTNITDSEKILSLYKSVAKYSGGIAREEDELTMQYVENNIQKSLQSGIGLVVEQPQEVQVLIGEIHTYKLEPRVFSHVLSELTIAVHPDFQGKGLGRILFESLIKYVETERTDILRVELIAREGNTKAIGFYQKIGFSIEGRFEKRINAKNGQFEADIPMAWFNKNFAV